MTAIVNKIQKEYIVVMLKKKKKIKCRVDFEICRVQSNSVFFFCGTYNSLYAHMSFSYVYTLNIIVG